MTLDLIYRVFYEMLSMIPRILVKSMHRIHIYSSILIFVVDIVIGPLCMRKCHAFCMSDCILKRKW